MCTAYTVHALRSARGPKLRATPCPSPPLLVTVGAKATAPSRARARPVALAVPGGWRARRAGAVVCGGGGARRRRCVGRVCRVRRRGRSVFHLNSLQMLLKDHAPGCRCRWPYAQSTMFVTRACFNISLERARGTSPRNERSGTLFSRDRHGDRHDLIDAELRVAARWHARPQHRPAAPICSTDPVRREKRMASASCLNWRAERRRRGRGEGGARRLALSGARLHSGVTVSARLLMRP